MVETVDKGLFSDETVGGEVYCRPLGRPSPTREVPDRPTLPTVHPNRKAFIRIKSPYPHALQTDIPFNGKPNRTQIQQRVDRLISTYHQSHLAIKRLSLHGNLMIEAPPSMTTIPFWAYRASGILPQRLMDAVIHSLDSAEAAGCKPHINPLKKAAAKARKRERDGLPPLPDGGTRSDYEVPFHIGVFKHPSKQFSQPWITKDTLQGLHGDTAKRTERIGKMMALCKSIDDMVNGRVQRLVGELSPELLAKCRQ